MKREEVHARILRAIEIMLPIRGNLEGDMKDMTVLTIGELMGLCLIIKQMLEEEKEETKH
jgi:hypothetical protein